MDHIKDFYTSYSDRITEKRFNSTSPLRRYAHAGQYASVLRFVEPGMRVLDAGCGEGTLSIMAAKKGAIVTGCDISAPNIEQCKKYAEKENVRIEFLEADGEQLPFPDNSFDLVLSSHVLEHLPDFDRGLREVLRVTKKRAVVAIPTVINPCSWVQVGRGWFYAKGLRSFAGLPIGFCRMLLALVRGEEGVNESYGGYDLPHVSRFPHVMKKKIHAVGGRLVQYEASSVCLPYFESLLPLTRWLDRYRSAPILRNCGYGTTFVIEK